MARGDKPAEEAPLGVFPNRKPRPIKAARIARRVARFVDSPPVVEGVIPVNPGFFKLQRMRSAQPAKGRAAVRQRVNGK